MQIDLRLNFGEVNFHSTKWKSISARNPFLHDDVIKWKHFSRCWPFVRGIHWSPVDFPHEGQWRGALIFSLIRAWTNGWAIKTPMIWDATPLIMTSLWWYWFFRSRGDACHKICPLQYAHGSALLCFIVVTTHILYCVIYLPIFFRTFSLVLGQA